MWYDPRHELTVRCVKQAALQSEPHSPGESPRGVAAHPSRSGTRVAGVGARGGPSGCRPALSQSKGASARAFSANEAVRADM